MGVCVSLLAHQGLFMPRISQKPREHVCRVGEAGHFAINAGGARRAVIEFQHRRSCVSRFNTLPVSFTITLAITLPTSRLSSVLPVSSVPPTAPVDSLASTSLTASGDAVVAMSLTGVSRRVLRPAPQGVQRRASVSVRPAFVLLLALVSAGLTHGAMAQMPKPMNPGTSVTETPLDEARSQTGTSSGSGTRVTHSNGLPFAASATSDPAAPADPNGFDARQKALDVRSEENNYEYGVKQHDCYSNFLVNHCLDRARDAKRAVSQQIRKEQLALDDERRLEHAQQRDAQTAIKRARYEAEAPQRAVSEKASADSFAEKQRQNALSAAQRTAEAPQRAQNQANYDRKQADYQKNLSDAAARGVQDARERDDKAARFEAKQRDAAEHQAEIQARQKEAALKQQQRAQQQEADRQHQEQLKQQQQQN
jgi:hypothetical protein